jgi:hypothetical protein
MVHPLGVLTALERVKRTDAKCVAGRRRAPRIAGHADSRTTQAL